MSATELYHLTRRSLVAQIGREGLRAGPRLFSGGDHTDSELDRIYGSRPVFLSSEPWVSGDTWSDIGSASLATHELALFAVNVTGLRLLADVMSLIDKGAYLEEGSLWFEQRDHPLLSWEDDGEISYELVRTDLALGVAALTWTGTVACLDPIIPSRLRQITIK